MVVIAHWLHEMAFFFFFFSLFLISFVNMGGYEGIWGNMGGLDEKSFDG